MGHRISKVITKTGDGGTTGLANGDRVRKNSPRVIAIGDVDELNCGIGLALTKLSPMTMGTTTLREVQHRLFDLGGELALPGTTVIEEQAILVLEEQAEAINETLMPLKNFIIPGGTQAAARLHFVTTICRRAERSLWTLDETEFVNPFSLRFLNRLSDLLFIMARQEHTNEINLWRQGT